MKLVILAGGKGTRLSEETTARPKPLVEIGGYPIIWHIMKLYSFYGINEFVICCGYKGSMIKDYFSNYSNYTSDLTINLNENKKIIHKKTNEKWKVTLVDTGENTMTGGRILRVKKYVDDIFCLTYGDGLGNINIRRLIAFHKKNKTEATLTAVRPAPRFGTVKINSKNLATKFGEKIDNRDTWYNGGFFVLNKSIFKYLKNDQTIWEKEPLEKITKLGQLSAYKHDDFWQPMDTIREKESLEELWNSNTAPWKLW